MAKRKKIIDFDLLQKEFEEVGGAKGKLGLSLLCEAKFMKKTLEDLQKVVEANGVVTQMCQGTYDIERANPALQAYNTTIKNYNQTIKQLNDMLPPINSIKKDDGFESFGE